MDPTDFLEDEDLLQFLHCRKAELSVIEDPWLFLNQLNDYNLVPTDMYEKVIRIRSKGSVQRRVYELLSWVERSRAAHIKLFWKCVFTDHLLLRYPELRQLRTAMMHGSVCEELPEKVEQGIEKKTAAGDEDRKGKKRKTRRRSGRVDEELAGPSSLLTPHKKKKVQKPHFESPLKKGQSRDIWTWEFYRTQLPVTCGDLKGILHRAKLARGEKCITVKSKWFTPAGFEELAGKKSCRNWKKSILCEGTPLDKLIKEGHLKSPGFSRNRNSSAQIKRTLSPRNHNNTSITVCSDSEEEERDTGGSDSEQASCHKDQPQVFKVTCGRMSGVLHKYRFASGIRGKSIRTEDSWMTPVEFQRAGSDSLRAGSDSPRAGSASPRAGSASLRAESDSPRAGSASPRAGSASPRAGSDSPRAGSASPRAGSASPRAGSASLRAGSASPRAGSASPRAGSASLRAGSASPRAGSASPRAGSASPRAGSASPRAGSASPRAESASPRAGSDSLRAGSDSLRAESDSSDDWRRDIQCDGKPLVSLIKEGSLTVHTQCVCRMCSSDPEDLEEQNSDDDCFICRGYGDLVMCDTCPRSYHLDCHLPRLDDASVNRECKWMCTVCVYQTSKDWRYPERQTLQEAQSCDVYTHLLECQYLLMFLYHADEGHIFTTDPCLQVQGYRRVVPSPMWLDKVKDKLLQEKYVTVQHFLTDLQLIFDNCTTFNKDNTVYREMGERLRGLFENEFQSVFRVQA